MSCVERVFGTSYCIIENDILLYFQRIPASVNVYSSRINQGYHWFKPTSWVYEGIYQISMNNSRLNILENMHAHRVLKQVPWLAVSLWSNLDDPDVVVKIMGLFIEMRK